MLVHSTALPDRSVSTRTRTSACANQIHQSRPPQLSLPPRPQRRSLQKRHSIISSPLETLTLRPASILLEPSHLSETNLATQHYQAGPQLVDSTGSEIFSHPTPNCFHTIWQVEELPPTPTWLCLSRQRYSRLLTKSTNSPRIWPLLQLMHHGLLLTHSSEYGLA